MSCIEEVKHLQIPLQELSDATNSFSRQNLIAKGGFGDVYKGISVKHGDIAIKMLDPGQGQGDHEFKTEIALLSVYKHENIVSLVGFCNEDGHKILVYKYESKGSLDKHLKSADLTWIQRLKICLDAAHGLEYLHDVVGSEHRIVHRDIKSSNVVLDENWKAKIADFGLSRLGPANVSSTFLISNVCGTIGYIDPDYYNTGYLTQKSDVYSFGVVLFEVLCGRLSRLREYKDERQFLTNMIKIHWRRKTLDEIIHPDIQKQIKTASLLTFSTIAYQCLMSGNERPTMKKVVDQLQKALDNQLAPSGPWSDIDDVAAHHQGKPAGFSTLSSSSSSQSWMLDVFISFSGDDMCKTVVDNLYSALIHRQVIIYMEDVELPREEEIKSASHIKQTRIAIVIFSPNYASSSGSLKELALIMKNRDTRGQIVIPIFYGVGPSEVRSQTRLMHKLNNNNKEVESWREALLKAVDLSGSWHVVNGNESEILQKIVSRISNELLSLTQHSETKAKRSANTDLIGIEARIQELKSLVKVGTCGVHKIGISGMWGSGKSTLAYCIYDEIRHEFEGCCFVKKVRARSRIHGLKALQEEILSNVLKLKVKLTNLEEGMHMIKRRLCQNNVLIVLDDVDHADHLDMLVGDNWFGDGSRIIFTTKNQYLVKARSSVTLNVRMLDITEAIELFSRRAFGKSKPSRGFEEVSLNIVCKLGGHPSALIRLSSFLYGKDMREWMGILDRLEAIPADEILKKFKLRTDGVATDISDRLLLDRVDGC